MDINDVLETLKEDYLIRKSLKRKNLKIQEELEEEIDDLEQSYISSCIMPRLEEFAKELLKDLECNTYLSITKDANGDINVSNEYGFDSSSHIGNSEVLVNDADGHNSVDEKPFSTTYRAGSLGFYVEFPDGTIIQHREAKDTLIESLRKIGFERVSTFKTRLFKGYPLVGKKKRTDGTTKWQEKIGDWYVYINMRNDTKIQVLEMISKELNLGLRIKTQTNTIQ